MRLILILLLVPFSLYAEKSGQIDASVNTIPIAFDNADAGSKSIQCSYGQHVMIQNETADRIAWGFGLVGTEPTTVHGFVVANNTVAKDGVTFSDGNYFYVRSDSGAPITVGTVSVECW